jgi:hypothetical protein
MVAALHKKWWISEYIPFTHRSLQNNSIFLDSIVNLEKNK